MFDAARAITALQRLTSPQARVPRGIGIMLVIATFLVFSAFASRYAEKPAV